MVTPRLTVAVLSWNRLHYLRATLESARLCIQYPSIEWIVSDNASDEPGLQEYLRSLTWLDHLIVKRQTHADAMNQIVTMATGTYVLIWPEDVQFTASGDWMTDLIELAERHPFIGSIGLDGQRRETLRSRLAPSWWRQRGALLAELRTYGTRFRRHRTVRSSRGVVLRTCGWAMEGVCGSGIPSLTAVATWRRLGPWRAGAPAQARLIDSSLGAEDDMVARFRRARWPLQLALPVVPVAADIITDPTGCKAKVRGNRRYGVYMPPVEGPFYYRIRPYDSLVRPDEAWPAAFMESVEPIGFRLPLDASGERLKSSINTSVVFDIARGEPVPYPLRLDAQPPPRGS